MGQEFKLDVKTQVTNRLGFKPNPKFNNFNIGILTNVEKVETDIDADKKWEYAGNKIASVRFEFKQIALEKGEPDRYLTISELPIECKDKDGVPVDVAKTWDKFVAQWKRVKHLQDQFRDVEGFIPYKEDSSDAPQFNPNATLKKRLDQFNANADNIVKHFQNAKGEPIYKDVNLIIKLTAQTRLASKTKKPYKILAIPHFIGKGCYDLYKGLNNNQELVTALEWASSEDVEIKMKSTELLGSSGDASVAPMTSDLPDDVKDIINAQ